MAARSDGTPTSGLRGIKPPANDVAERALIGLLMAPGNRAELFADARLQESLFWNPDMRTLFRAVQAVLRGGRPVDVVTVAEELRGMGVEWSMRTEPVELVAFALDSGAIPEETLRVLEEFRQRRQVVWSATRVLEAALAGREAFAEEVGEGVEELIGVFAGPTSRRGRSLGAAARDVLQEVLKRTPGMLDGVESGFAPLDKLLRGLQRGGLILLAGRPGMGKSSVMQQVLEHVARHGRVLTFTIEMSDRELAARGISRRIGVANLDFLANEMTGQDRERAQTVVRTFEAMGDRPWVYDISRLTVGELLAIAIRESLAGPLDLVVIDYLGLLADQRLSGERGDEVIQRQTNALKQLARRLKCPVLLVCQLNRELTKRKQKRPTLADLRGSGSLEQDADAVLFLHREEYYESGDKVTVSEDAELIVAKNRRGPTGILRFIWIGETMELRLPADEDRSVPDARYESMDSEDLP